MSNSSVLTNERTGKKKGLGTDLNRPRFAIMNPELTYTIPKYQLTCGIVDIMMHTLDRYFTPVEGNQMTDRIAENLLQNVIENGRIAFKDQTDYDAMSELMWCSSLSHNGITGLGGTREFAVHKLGHELSAAYDVAHGASLSATWGAWAKYVMMAKPERFAQYARKVWNVEETDDIDAAIAGIEKTVEYFASLDMPVCLPDLEQPGDKGKVGVLSEEVLYELADRVTAGDTMKISTLQPMNREDILNIYRLANKEA